MSDKFEQWIKRGEDAIDLLRDDEIVELLARIGIELKSATQAEKRLWLKGRWRWKLFDLAVEKLETEEPPPA